MASHYPVSSSGPPLINDLESSKASVIYLKWILSKQKKLSRNAVPSSIHVENVVPMHTENPCAYADFGLVFRKL